MHFGFDKFADLGILCIPVGVLLVMPAAKYAVNRITQFIFSERFARAAGCSTAIVRPTTSTFHGLAGPELPLVGSMISKAVRVTVLILLREWYPSEIVDLMRSTWDP